MSDVLNDVAGRIVFDPYGSAALQPTRPEARVSLSVAPGADEFQVGLVSITDEAATHIWIGTSRVKVIAIADLPATVPWGDVTSGSGDEVRLRGGVQGQPATWKVTVGRGEVIVEPPEPIGSIDPVLLFVGDPDYVLETRFFFNDGGGVLTFALAVDDAPPPAGWTINPSTGQFRIVASVARPSSVVVVTATSSLGGVPAVQTFPAELRAGAVLAPPTWAGGADEPLDVVAEVGDGGGSITVVFGSGVDGDDLEFSLSVTDPNVGAPTGVLPDGYGLDEAGDIILPTLVATEVRTVEAVATNSSGALVKIFDFECQDVVEDVDPLIVDVTASFVVKEGSPASIGGVAKMQGAKFSGPTPNYGKWLFFRDGEPVQVDADDEDPTTWTNPGNEFVMDDYGLYTGRVGRVFDGPPQQFVFADATGSIELVAPPPPPDPDPEDPDPVSGEIPAPTDAMLTRGMLNGANTRPAQDYDFVKYGHDDYPNEQSTGVNNKKGVFLPTIVAIAAFLGVETVKKGQTPAQHMVAMLKNWCANGLPAARGGLTFQVDIMFVYAACLAKRTPDVWNNLTGAEKTRIDLCMQGHLISAMWQNSDNNFYVKGGKDVYNFASERTLTGAQYGRGRVANFITPSALMPALACSYFGGADIAAGATFCENFAKTFNRDNFAAAILAASGGGATAVGGLKDMWDTFRKDWTGTNAYYGDKDTVKGPGPTKAQLYAAINQGPGGAGTPYTQYGGQRIGETNAMLLQQIDKVFARVVRFGKQVNAGTNLSRGTSFVPGKDGVFEALNTPGSGGTGRNRQVGCGTETVQPGATRAISAKQAWDAGEHDYIGLVGMCSELDTNDGGSGPGDGGIRSAMTYAYEGVTIITPAILLFAALGLADPNDPAFAVELHKVHVGSNDLEFRMDLGHENFAKAGPFGAKAGGGDWNKTWYRADALAFNYDVLNGFWFECIAPWAGFAKVTTAPAITGLAKVGQTLTCSNGAWLNSPAIGRRWEQRIGNVWTVIAGVNGATYNPVAGNIGRPLRCRVKATTPKGDVYFRTAATANVIA